MAICLYNQYESDRRKACNREYVESDIAAQLWLTKPAGIETYGNISVSVADSAGDMQLVSFSRSVPKYAWVNVVINSLNPEESLPAAAALNIKQSIVDYALANIGTGDDIIIQRLYGPIFYAVMGLGSITITIATTALTTDTPSYSSSNISIGRAENSVFDISRITVSGI